jgi:hypothetical protein
MNELINESIAQLSIGMFRPAHNRMTLTTAAGFRWWPIKAYRPCGKAAQAGIEYSRKGQGVDEVMFGRK